MWVALDPVQTLLVDSLKVIMNSSVLKLALRTCRVSGIRLRTSINGE